MLTGQLDVVDFTARIPNSGIERTEPVDSSH